jgi:3',5'-cyclic AMP phosphodiesterase CpdA
MNYPDNFSSKAFDRAYPVVPVQADMDFVASVDSILTDAVKAATVAMTRHHLSINAEYIDHVREARFDAFLHEPVSEARVRIIEAGFDEPEFHIHQKKGAI